MIQFFLIVFLLFALSRVVLQVRSANITVGSFLFWGGLFIFALVGVIEPGITSQVAAMLGIGRGADVVIYISIALLFYLIFRLSIALEETRKEITEVVRRVALENLKKSTNRHKKTSSK